MYKNFTILLAISLLFFQNKGESFFGALSFPHAITKKPYIFAFYSNGEHTIVKDGIYEIIEEGACPLINILCTEEVSCVCDPDDGDMLYLETIPAMPSRYFHCTRINEGTMWDIEEKELEKDLPFKIPLAYTIVLLMPPHWVEDIISPVWEHGMLAKLPTIIIDKNLQQLQVNKELLRSSACAVNIRAWYSRTIKNLVHRDCVTIAAAA